MIRFFIAAPLAECVRASAIADELERCGRFQCVSRWHRKVKPTEKDPRDDEQRRGILADNLADLRQADILIGLFDSGHPRASFAEVGFALALSKPVVWVHDSGTGRNIFDAHSLVVRVDTRGAVLDTLSAVVMRALWHRSERLVAGTISSPEAAE